MRERSRWPIARIRPTPDFIARLVRIEVRLYGFRFSELGPALRCSDKRLNFVGNIALPQIGPQGNRFRQFDQTGSWIATANISHFMI